MDAIMQYYSKIYIYKESARVCTDVCLRPLERQGSEARAKTVAEP